MPPATLILIDGLCPDALAAVDCPHIDSLRARGATTLQATSVMPSVTLPCHMSIFYSVPPTRHGIISNIWAPMARPTPGLFEMAQTAGLRCASLYNWEQLRDLSRPGTLDLAYYRDNADEPDGDQVIAAEAARYIAANGPDLTFIYLGALDSFGHKHGWMTEGYLAQLARTDLALGTVLDALPDETTLLLLSDHGGHDRMHGTDLPEDLTIPWIIAGPGVRRGYEIQAPVNLIDTAPTLAHAIGIDPHPEWEGRCVHEAFDLERRQQ